MDTSTLSYAFRGGHPEFRAPREPPEFSHIHTFVERVAREDNLCLSSMHLAELAQGDEARVNALLRWLDSLDIVWTFSFDKIGDREDERALQLAVGATPHAPVEAFARNMSAIFRDWQLTPEQRNATIYDLAQAAQSRGQTEEHGFMDEMGAALYSDRHEDPETANLTKEEKKTITARKRREFLESEGARAWDRLRHYELPAFHRRYHALPNAHATFADYVTANPTALPSTFVAEAFSIRFAEVMAGRKPGGGGAKKLRSSFYDYAHLGIGAAYCDVFTCDALSAQCLGDAPRQIGRQMPVVYRNNDAGKFVRTLEAARQ